MKQGPRKTARQGGSRTSGGPDRPAAGLRAVAEDEPAPTDARRAGAGRVPILGLVGLLAVALAVMSLLFVSQVQRAAQLGDQVETLGAALEVARQELVVHQRRMQLVRGHVEDLAGRVEALGRLVAVEGTAAPLAGARTGGEAEASAGGEPEARTEAE